MHWWVGCRVTVICGAQHSHNACPRCWDHFLKVHYMRGSGTDELTHSYGTIIGVSLIQTINVPGQKLQTAVVEGSRILLTHTLT